MPTAVIVDAIRTPLGKRNGRLKDWHPVDLAAETLKALVDRTGIDPALVDDVVMGCVMQVGEQAVNIARNAVLAAGWPETVPGTTVDRQCGSSQQAAHFAAQGVIAGAYDVVVAAGVEVMTRVPMGASMADGKYGFPFGPKVGARYAAGRRPRAPGHLGRDDRRQVGRSAARRSTPSACARSSSPPAATRRGPLRARDPPGARRRGRADDHRRGHPRDDAREAGHAEAVVQGGRQGDGRPTRSQITDGAAALLIMSEEKAAAARPDAPGPLRAVRAGRRRPAAHAHRAHPGHRRRCSSGPA